MHGGNGWPKKKQLHKQTNQTRLQLHQSSPSPCCFSPSPTPPVLGSAMNCCTHRSRFPWQLVHRGSLRKQCSVRQKPALRSSVIYCFCAFYSEKKNKQTTKPNPATLSLEDDPLFPTSVSCGTMFGAHNTSSSDWPCLLYVRY